MDVVNNDLTLLFCLNILKKAQLHKLVYNAETYNVTYITGVSLLVQKFIWQFQGSRVHWETASSFTFFTKISIPFRRCL